MDICDAIKLGKQIYEQVDVQIEFISEGNLVTRRVRPKKSENTVYENARRPYTLLDIKDLPQQ